MRDKTNVSSIAIVATYIYRMMKKVIVQFHGVSTCTFTFVILINEIQINTVVVGLRAGREREREREGERMQMKMKGMAFQATILQYKAILDRGQSGLMG